MQIKRDIFLAPFTTFKIGGPGDYFVVAKSSEDLKEAIIYAQENKLSFFILGEGANILIGDKGYRGLVIKNEARKVTISHPELVSGSHEMPKRVRHDNYALLTSESGATIADLIKFTVEKGLSGLEHFVGIPSTIGGALWQNLHFLSPDRKSTVYIGDILEEAEILTYSSSEEQSDESRSNSSRFATLPRTITVNRDYFNFDYDQSSLKDNKDVVLSATLKLIRKDKKEIEQVIEENLKWRREKQPENANENSVGSIFKKIEGYGAGRLIEKVGLKGKHFGGAQISQKHANFIVNNGKATAKEVMDLIHLVQEKVRKELGLHLTPEISFVGEF